MKQILSDDDRSQLDKQIIEAEKRTKVQIVLATAQKSDTYAEIPWKAFAFGTSVAAFVMVMQDLLLVSWGTDLSTPLYVGTILGTGVIFVFLTILFQGFARLFVSDNRMELETKQYADSLFLSRELFATESRSGILLFVSRFERQVVIVPDKGIRTRVSVDVMKNIISAMIPLLRQNEVRNAMTTGLEELVTALGPPVSEGPDKNELSNEIIEGGPNE